MNASATFRPKPRIFSSMAEPAFGLASFLLAIYLYDATGYSPLPVETYYASVAISALTFWLATALRDDSEPSSFWKVLQEIFCLALGLNLLSQALMAYVYSTLMLDGMPFFALLCGCLLASIATSLLWPVLHPHPARRPGVLLIGFDRIMRQWVDVQGNTVAGAVGTAPELLPISVPSLGGTEQLRATLDSTQPGRIVVSQEYSTESNVLLELFHQRTQGVIIQSSAAAYERSLDRTSIESLSPLEFVASARLATDRQMLAFQSVYNNLAGLTVLALMLPLILLTVATIRLFGGRGPSIEALECAGFQKIPFQMLRFRTTRPDGTTSTIGRILRTLHLVNLPQFINVIRGEMAIFGPRPVRVEYAERMAQLVPFYSQIFVVKPGIVSWADIHFKSAQPTSSALPNDWLRLEYDLYFIKQSSPRLDLEILLRILFRAAPAKGETIL